MSVVFCGTLQRLRFAASLRSRCRILDAAAAKSSLHARRHRRRPTHYKFLSPRRRFSRLAPSQPTTTLSECGVRECIRGDSRQPATGRFTQPSLPVKLCTARDNCPSQGVARWPNFTKLTPRFGQVDKGKTSAGKPRRAMTKLTTILRASGKIPLLSAYCSHVLPIFSSSAFVHFCSKNAEYLTTVPHTVCPTTRNH